MGAVGIDENVAIAVTFCGARDRDLLVPAVLSADRIGLYRKDQVLVDTGVLPMNAR